MNPVTAVNLVNLLSSLSPETHQQLINLIQPTQYHSQPQSYSQYPPINSNNINHIPPTTNQLQSSFNDNQSPQNLFTMLTQFTPNPNNTDHYGSLLKQSHTDKDLSTKLCSNVKECPSIKRIVKLGVFYSKYGEQNASLIANYMCQSSEYNNLNNDYQHSVKYHLGNDDKHKIIEMSTYYKSIYDFISNFNPNQELDFYNKTMDTIYNGITPLNTFFTPFPSNKTDSTTSNNNHQGPTSISISLPTITNNISTSIPSILNNNYNINTRYKLPDLTRYQYTNNTANTTPYRAISPHSSNTSSSVSVIKTEENLSFSMNHNTSTNSIHSGADPKSFIKINTVNTKDISSRKYKCSSCDKQYKHLCNLKSHQKIHTDKALICAHCNKRFGRKANYNEHLRIHTGETPYQCSFCQKRFKHHHSWKDHVRIHTGVTPYQCNFCHRKFKVGHNLTVHRRIHTGEKPYQCKICNKSFRQKSAINSHLKRMHK